MHELNIAALCPSTKVLGPGQRFVVWMQGCCFNCPSCGSPEWREMKDEILITPEDLAEQILGVPDLEGITLSGGEPMLQAENLLNMIRAVRTQKNLSVICYTGFLLNNLHEKNDIAINELLKKIDILIDGPYVSAQNDNRGLRGSSNQHIHFLSGLYAESAEDFKNRPRDIEIYLHKDHYLMVGIHPKNIDCRSLF